MPGLGVRIYDCFITAVSPDDRTLHALSRNGTKFRDVSYMLPYINLLGGGIDFVPQSGDPCLILASEPESVNVHKGRFSVVIGFKMPTTPQAEGLELGQRLKDLPPGSIALRATDEQGREAKVIAYRGGTVLIGTGRAAVTCYSPLDNSIIHLFNNWEMLGPGGEVKWTREEGAGAMSYTAEYRTNAKAEDGGMKVNLRIGGEGDGPVELVVNDAASPFDPPPLRIAVNADGEAIIEGQSIIIKGDKGVDIDAGNVTIKKRSVNDQSDAI